MPTTTKTTKPDPKSEAGLRVFIDTNIFLTTIDKNDPHHASAKDVLADVRRDSHVYISTQVLQEFYNSATKQQRGPVVSKCASCGRETFTKRPAFLNDADAAETVRALVETEQVIPVSETVIENALEIMIEKRSKSGQRGIQWYDAVIVASAQLAGCDVLLTRDMQHGEVIRGVRIRNPWAKVG